MIKKLLKSDFLKNSFTVFSGTLLAQLIGFLVLPITSRLYSEGQFGILSLIVSTTTVLASIGTLKYEQAILLPKSNNQAFLLTKISLLISLTLSILSFFVITLFSGQIASLLGDSSVQPFLYVIPVLLFFNCFGIINKNYGIRQKKFRLMSAVDVLKAIIGGGGQIVLGIYKPTAVGLLSGPLLSSISANFYLFKKLSSYSIKEIFNFNKQTRLIKLLLKRYKDFPLYNVPATVANNLVLHGQNIFIFSLFTAGDLGQLSMSQKLLAAPTVLISSSIANVYLNKLKEDKLKSLNLRRNFKKTLFVLTAFALPFSVLGYFLIPVIIPLFLGSKWQLAAELATILVFIYAIRMIVSPLSGIMIILEKQKQNFYLILIQLSTILMTFIVVKIYSLELVFFVEIYVVVQIIFYLFYLLYLNNLIKKHNDKIN